MFINFLRGFTSPSRFSCNQIPRSPLFLSLTSESGGTPSSLRRNHHYQTTTLLTRRCWWQQQGQRCCPCSSVLLVPENIRPHFGIIVEPPCTTVGKAGSPLPIFHTAAVTHGCHKPAPPPSFSFPTIDGSRGG